MRNPETPPANPSVVTPYDRKPSSLHLPRLRFDRHELAGSVGDLGTSLPLIVGMVLTAGLDPASVLIVFGTFQILTGVAYGLPMPMQPLKAMAALVIAGQVTKEQLYGGGLAIGAAMLALSLTGGLTWLARAIPKPVVRGIQVGLGLTLANIALKTFLPDAGLAKAVAATAAGEQIAASLPGWTSLFLLPGFLLALIGFAILLFGRSHGRWWAGPAVVGLGLAVAALAADWRAVAAGTGFSLPQPHIPGWADIAAGFLLLALPQLPLSISNSVIATDQTVRDLFPERATTVRKIGLTYATLNLVAPWLSGIPVCHGCGGLAGHYALGGRTGGSVVIYGGAYLLVGLFLAGSFGSLASAFPLPLLGVLLLFEALTLLSLARELAGSSRDWTIALVVALSAFGLPQGYLVGVIAGLLLDRLLPRAPAEDGAP